MNLPNLPFLKEKSAPQAGNPSTPAQGKGKKRLGKKRLVAFVVAAALVCAVGSRFLGGGASPARAAGLAYTTMAVERRDITASITGSGALEAANSYSVTSMVEGTILAAGFEEGDQVEEGGVLYSIDSSDTSSSLEQAEISLEQAQRNYNKQLENQAKLNVAATVSGQVYSLEVEVGDEVNAGQTIATIRDADTMSLTVSFSADDASAFYVGQPAAVTLDSTFETLSGAISKISGIDTVLTGNVIVRSVTIDVSNPGGLSTSQSASAAVGGVTSTGSGTFSYSAEKTVTAKVSGEVAALSVSEGDQVYKGQTLVVLTSDSLEDSIQSAADSLRNAQLSLENQYDRLDNYTITSPISGTVIDKYFKAGETAEANQMLCTIYDLSYLTMTLSVDELDIADIAVGQSVSVTADAVEGKTYEGVVTKVSVAGTYSGGVTTYPVTIRIDETEGLLPGMNVDATIVLNSADDVLAIPAAALNRGNTVLVTADSPSAGGGSAQNPGGGEGEGGSDYVSVQVAIGVSDDSYIEILSGLQEGDTVAYIPSSSSGSGNQMGMMMGGGASMGGGMPSGGGGGGAPGGGPGGF